MSGEDFNFLLKGIPYVTAKKDTTFQRAVPADERLAVSLRFLATGDSYNRCKVHLELLDSLYLK